MAAAENITHNFELILVNDGSPDGSLELALSIRRKDHRVRVIDLSRNFGQHKAIMTGLAHARGELIFLIDDDLEEEPELLNTFYENLRSSDADVIFGVQRRRKGSLFEQLSGALFFLLFNALSTHRIPKNVVTARLMTKRYVSALLMHHEREILIAGLWTLTGFKQVPVVVNKTYRKNSSYSLTLKFSHLVNAITSFSIKPLVVIFYLGCFILLASAIAAIDLIVRKLFFGGLLQGWSTLVVSIWLLGGLNIFCLGVIGIYLSKVFIEVKQRPQTIIRQVFEEGLCISEKNSKKELMQSDV